MGRRWAAGAVTAMVIALGVIGSGDAPVTAAGHHFRAPQTRAASADLGVANPATNIDPSPDYWPACAQSGVSSQPCTDAVLAAINNARSLEGVPPMVLPDSFGGLTTAEQTFIVSNLERVDRGLSPASGMVGALNSLSSAAADADSDPILPSWTVGTFSAHRWGSIWAGDLNALAADYDWMYDDGWGPNGSYNLDCQTATSAGCWGHRENILQPTDGQALITGVGSAVQAGWTSIAQIFVTGTGALPAFTFAWSDVPGVATTPPSDSGAPTDPGAPGQSDPSPVAVQPQVAMATFRATGGWTVAATVTPALGQPVRLRRQTATGWVTVRRTTASASMIFNNLRRGHYRLIVSPMSGSLRAVADLRVH